MKGHAALFTVIAVWGGCGARAPEAAENAAAGTRSGPSLHVRLRTAARHLICRCEHVL